MTVRGKLIDENEAQLTVEFYWPSDLKRSDDVINEFFEKFEQSNVYIEWFDGDTGNLLAEDVEYNKSDKTITVKFINESKNEYNDEEDDEVEF